MKKNIGTVDRLIRGVLGIAIAVVGYRYHSWWGLLGVVLLLTALISWCPLYIPFKIDTGAKAPPAKTG